jgi:putative addiction module component (TIGR02574 family)
MSTHVGQLIDEALALAPEERSALALALLDSLPVDGEAAVSKAWAEEIRRRKEELRSGAAKAVRWEQAKARLSAL